MNDAIPNAGMAGSITSLHDVTGVVRKLNIGYFWMLFNCLASASYVSCVGKRVRDDVKMKTTLGTYDAETD